MTPTVAGEPCITNSAREIRIWVKYLLQKFCGCGTPAPDAGNFQGTFPPKIGGSLGPGAPVHGVPTCTHNREGVEDSADSAIRTWTPLGHDKYSFRNSSAPGRNARGRR